MNPALTPLDDDRPTVPTSSTSHAPRNAFLVATGISFAAMLTLGAITSVVAAVPVMAAWVAIAFGYSVWRHHQSRHGEELQPRATGSATLVGGAAARNLGADRPREISTTASTVP